MKNKKSKTEPLDAIVKNLNLGHYKSHFFLCTGPKCCLEVEGLRVWNYLKKRIKEAGLEGQVFRTKAGCLRICRDGPIALCYPKGDWYKQVDEILIEKLIQEMLTQKKDVEESRFARNPL